MINLDKIERDARKATSGEWKWDPSDSSFHSLQDERSHAVTVAYADALTEEPRISISNEDATHIANCSPDVVLELVRRIRQYEQDAHEREQDAMDRDIDE